MPDLVSNKQHLIWCQRVWDGLGEGGVWMVPRSGLIFQKSEILKRMTLIERMPYRSEMPGTADDWLAYQDSDFHAIAKRFALIGVECSL